jgi:hypothetical protein
VFRNRVLRRIVIGDWRELRDEELHHFYSSPDIIRVIISRTMRSEACSTHDSEWKFIQHDGRKEIPWKI